MVDKRLLVIDDEPRFGRFVKNVAAGLGYEVCVTTDAHSFMRAFDQFQPTTIVLDMIMPEMDGNELILWLADQQCSARLIIITGYSPDYATHAETLAKHKGFASVTTLHKPVDITKLRATLTSEKDL